MAVKLCFIRESYFIKNINFIKMLDCGNSLKQSKRSYICLKISVDENNYYIPLRNNLGDEIRKFGRIGHSVPTEIRCNAGLDYRYALIVNDESYIEVPDSQRIPQAQINIITSDYNEIEEEFVLYLTGFIKAAIKNRLHKEPLYRESSLVNFLDLLFFKDHY